MEQYILYLVIKDMVKNIDDRFRYSFNDMDSNSDYVCGIYIKGAEPSQYRALSGGEYYNIINRVQFLVQGGLDNNSLMDTLRLVSKIKYALIRASNRYKRATSGTMGIGGWISTSTSPSTSENVVIDDTSPIDGTPTDSPPIDADGSLTVMISKVDLISDAVSLGKSEQGRPRYSINFRIQYELGGK